MIISRRIVTVVAVGLVSLGGAACKKKEGAPAAGSGSGSVATGSGSAMGGTAAAVDAAVAVEVDAAAAAVPTGLLPFGPAGGANALQAADLASQAMSALMSGETDPVALAVAAVKADPFSPQARVALACVTGDEAFDLAQLTPLTTATGCLSCADAILNLRTGGADCEWTDAVRALANKITPSPQRAAADAIVSSLSTGDPAAATPFFKAAKVDYFVGCSVCDGNEGDVKKKLAGAKLLKQLTDQVKKAEAEEMGGIVVGEGMLCAADCCEVDIDQLMHNHDFLSKICFAPGTDQVSKIEIVSGG